MWEGACTWKGVRVTGMQTREQGTTQHWRGCKDWTIQSLRGPIKELGLYPEY